MPDHPSKHRLSQESPVRVMVQAAAGLAVPALVVLILALWIYTRNFPATPDVEKVQHEAGAHGGAVASLAGDRFHAEAIFERGGMLRLFTFGRDASQVLDVERQTLTAYVKSPSGTESHAMVLRPQPQIGDAPGRTSQFVGQLPGELADPPGDIVIPALRIAGGRYRARFTLIPQPHEPPMPVKVADDEERQLYLVPAGLYTDADIAANGGVTPSQKFPAFRPQHNFDPQPGDRLCPITRTKANSQCQWIINGKVYDFCCPPCIDEFVRLAKESPDGIGGPEAYVQQ